MLYNGNVRSDGRVIKPHELVYGYHVLNTKTGKFEYRDRDRYTYYRLDEDPEELEVHSDAVYVTYENYTKIHHIGGSRIVKIDLEPYNGIVKEDGSLEFRLDSTTYNWKNYTGRCKRLIQIHKCHRVGKPFTCEYITHGDEIKLNNLVYSKNILDSFIVAEDDYKMYIYDISSDKLHECSASLSRSFYKIHKKIIDMVVYGDGVEIATDDDKGYVIMDDKFMEIGPEWSLRPTFTQLKSARNI